MSSSRDGKSGLKMKITPILGFMIGLIPVFLM